VGIGKAQAGGAQTVAGDWVLTFWKVCSWSSGTALGENAIVADGLDFEQVAICGRADFEERGQIDPALADAEMVAIVDLRLGCATLRLSHVILLDLRTLLVSAARA
jgi:hypothetical protein